MSHLPKALTLGVAASMLAGMALAQPAIGNAEPTRAQPKPELERGPGQQRQIALTFDAGGGNEGLPTLLRVLKHEDVVATFFLTGKWAGEFPAYAARIVEGGHVIGNHTWGHKDLTKLADSDIAQEILRADDRFVSSFGGRYRPLFRAPFGEVNGRVLSVVERLGFRAVRWSIDTLDSVEPRKTASFIEDRVLGRSNEELCGAIVLMHVGYAETGAALPVIIRNLRERNFEFVPVSFWVPQAQPVLTGLREGILPRDGSPRPDLNWNLILSFDDQATQAAFPAWSTSVPEHQTLRSRHRWTFSLGNRSTTHTPQQNYETVRF